MQLIQSGELHPEIVITHEPTLDKAPQAYEVFNKKLDGCIKVQSLFCGQCCLAATCAPHQKLSAMHRACST